MRNLAILFVVGATASVASAYGPAVTGFTGGGGPFSSYYGVDPGDVVGYRFTSDLDQFVTALGVLDDPIDGVLDSAHMVGLWDAGGGLMASASASTAGTLIDGWWYADITPVALSAGDTYTLGALYLSADGDGYWSGPSSMTYDGISSTVAVYPALEGLGFVYPEFDSPGNLGRLGPNMITAPIPAPSSLALLGLGGLALRRRR